MCVRAGRREIDCQADRRTGTMTRADGTRVTFLYRWCNLCDTAQCETCHRNVLDPRARKCPNGHRL